MGLGGVGQSVWRFRSRIGLVLGFCYGQWTFWACLNIGEGVLGLDGSRAADGLSPVVRGGREGCQRAAVAPKVASSPRGRRPAPLAGNPVQSLPRAACRLKGRKGAWSKLRRFSEDLAHCKPTFSSKKHEFEPITL